MQSARCCIVMLLRHGLAQRGLAQRIVTQGPRIWMRRREVYRSELLYRGNRLAREVSWPSQAPIVYLRRRTEDFHV
jgi:hypothetical protein